MFGERDRDIVTDWDGWRAVRVFCHPGRGDVKLLFWRDRDFLRHQRNILEVHLLFSIKITPRAGMIFVVCIYLTIQQC